ncbi:MAG: hypothetical protein OXF01_01120 [Gemmatimonadetes bacterium]|nr:hypothetical protein [Gemmatimonadota bacterium]
MKHATIHRRIATLGVLAAAIAIVLPASLSAQRGAGGARGGMFNDPGIRLWTQLDENYEEFTEQLTITEEQGESIATLLTDFREKNEQGLEEYSEMRQSMGNRAGGGGGGGGNRQAMQATFQRMQTLLEKLGPAFEKLHTDVGELLTADQTKKLAELLQPPRRPGG